MLARVSPALFPGKNIINVPVIGDIQRKIAITPPSDDSAYNSRKNILIMGVDQRPLGPDAEKLPDEVRFAGRTDTLMVATVDPLAKTMSFLGFPRDMYIDIHPPQGGTYKDRINASFVLGLNNGHSVDAGAKQLEKDMKANFGIDIDYYVLMDFKGVEKLVNAVGGVDLDIPYELSVPSWYYSDDDEHAVWLSFPAGPQHLDGYHAVAFGRNRDPSDMTRIKRQQLVLQGAIKKVFAQGLLNPTTWPELWDAYSSTVKTDMPKSKMVGLAPLLQSTNGRATTYSVGDPVDDKPTVWGEMTDEGASVLEWDPQNVQYWLTQTFTKAAYSQSTVEIQNGFGTDGAARAASLGRFLVYSKGLPTVYYGPDQPARPDTAIILYSDKKRELADDIAKWLNIPPSTIKVQPRGEDSTLPDVVIVIGRDYKIPGG